MSLLTQQGENYVSSLAVDSEIAEFGKGSECRVGFGFFCLVSFFNTLALDLEILPVQALRYFRQQGFCQPRQKLTQQASLSGRQPQSQGPFRRIKIVQIA